MCKYIKVNFLHNSRNLITQATRRVSDNKPPTIWDNLATELNVQFYVTKIGDRETVGGMKL